MQLEKDMILEKLLLRLERLMERAEQLLDSSLFSVPSQTPSDELFKTYVAFRWVCKNGSGRLSPVAHPDLVDLSDLIGLERQVSILVRNTRQFLRGLPANHVLLFGDRGTGKSSAVKGLLKRFAPEGLRLIEARKDELLDLPALTSLLWERPERFLLFCDDLSFAEEEAAYKELKALLEGSIVACPENVLIYATSNRRHLIKEIFRDNRLSFDEQGEIHPQETVEEKISLSDRFGLRLGFYRIDQETYLKIVSHYAKKRGLALETEALYRQALQWAADSSGLSGRGARQFVDDLTGRLGL